MLIKNNRINIVNVHGLTGKDVERVTSWNRFTLVPGVNKIDDKCWQSISKHPMISLMLDQGDLEVITNKDGDKEKAKKDAVAIELEGLDIKKAVSVIKSTNNVELLNSWLENDSRPKVQSAINKQLKSLDLTDDEKKAVGL